MDKQEKTFWVIVLSFICTVMFFSYSTIGRRIWNEHMFDLNKVDEETKYETIKEVEDTCRTMIASYQSDKLTYEQYKDSDNEEKQSWAEQAKMRANKTAITYNEFILKNSFVWDGNVPSDIDQSLPIIE